MSAGRSMVAAGICGVILWAFKREAERTQGQGGDAVLLKSSLSTGRVANPRSVDRSKLVSAAFDLFGGIAKGERPAAEAPQGLGSILSRAVGRSAPTQGGSGGGEPLNIGAQLMHDLQRDFGLKRHQAAGVVGNLDHESAGFKSLQEIKPLVAGSRGGWGYAQWTGPRRRQFEAWVSARGLDARSYAANYGFLKHELTQTEEKRVLRRLRAAKTVDEAARVFSGSSQRGNSFDGFLRPGIPHLDSRIQRARRYA